MAATSLGLRVKLMKHDEPCRPEHRDHMLSTAFIDKFKRFKGQARDNALNEEWRQMLAR